MICFVEPSHSILHQIADEVSLEELSAPENQKLIDEMLLMARGEQKDAKRALLVGLSAPQIGIAKRIILVDVGANGKGIVSQLNAYINPEITWRSEEKNEWYEACYSTGRVTGIVSRPSKIEVTAYNREGKRVTEEHSGYVARIFQHEIDHLNGIRFPVYVTDASKLHLVEQHEFPLYRNQEGWRNWPHKCPREEWEKFIPNCQK